MKKLLLLIGILILTLGCSSKPVENADPDALLDIETQQFATLLSPEDTSRSDQVSPKTIMTAKEKLISIGYNVPKHGSVAAVNQEYVASLDVPDEYRERFLEIQTGFPNPIKVMRL